MAEQLSLIDLVPECQDFMDIKKKAEKMALANIGFQMPGEERWEYRENLRDETRLCYAELLRQLADKIETETLARQKEVIQILYGHGKKPSNENNKEIKKCG